MAAINQTTTAPESVASAPSKALIVSQPEKLEGLLETINLMNMVSERMGEDASHDLGGSSGTTGSVTGDDQPISARDQAIAAMPTIPVMQKELAEHILQTIKDLRYDIKKQTAKGGKAGSAYKLNESFKRMRRLQRFLGDLLHASADVLRRIYIRVFIDKQPLTSQ